MTKNILIILLFLIIQNSCNKDSISFVDNISYCNAYSRESSIVLKRHKQSRNAIYNKFILYKEGFKLTGEYITAFKNHDSLIPDSLRVIKLIKSNEPMRTKFPYKLDFGRKKTLVLLKPLIPEVTRFIGKKSYIINDKRYLIEKYYFDERDTLNFYKSYYLKDFGFICYASEYLPHEFTVCSFSSNLFKIEDINSLINKLMKDTTFFEKPKYPEKFYFDFK